MEFKVGDRASFGGIRGTVVKVDVGTRPVLWVADSGPRNEFWFTPDGRYLMIHTKPLLIPLKKKKREKRFKQRVMYLPMIKHEGGPRYLELGLQQTKEDALTFPASRGYVEVTVHEVEK